MSTPIVPVPEVVLAPEFPTLADRPAGTYNTKAAAWANGENLMATRLGEIAVVTYHNALAAHDRAQTAEQHKDAAAKSASDAAAAANAAATTVGAQQWQSGKPYAVGDAAWSPLNMQTYRRITAGAGALDPSLDPDKWALLGGVFNRYDLASAATTTTLDLATSNVFRVDASSPCTLAFANEPEEGRAMGVLVKIIGSSEITWPAGIAWDTETAPQLGASWTEIGLINDGEGWTGNVRASA